MAERTNQHKAPKGETRLRIYAFYLSYWRRHHYAPTVREAGEFVGVKQPVAQKHVANLIQEGKLEYDQKSTGWRAVRPVVMGVV